MKIKVPNAKPTSGRTQKAGGRKRYRKPPPSHIVLVPDPENEGKLTRIGAMWRFASGKNKGRGYSMKIDDDPRAIQLAYENLKRIVILPYEG
jgi:hypothetical protein